VDGEDGPAEPSEELRVRSEDPLQAHLPSGRLAMHSALVEFLRDLARHAALPGVLGAALAALLIGPAYGVPATALLAPVLLASVFVVAVLERWIPYRSDWNQTRGDVLPDALYLPTTALATGVMRPLVTVVGVLIEVPLMLMLVRVCLRTRDSFPEASSPLPGHSPG